MISSVSNTAGYFAINAESVSTLELHRVGHSFGTKIFLAPAWIP